MKLSWEGLGVILANLGGLACGIIFGSFWWLAALEGLLERLGLVLGRLEGILESWTVLEGSWELLGGLGSVLATSWESSWRLWGAILGMSGPSWAEKTYKRVKKSLSRGLPILTSILE